jgi:hypothetical protein
MKVKPDFKPDMTALEAAYIARFYAMDTLKKFKVPKDFEFWEQIKRHFIEVKDA